MKSMKQEKNGKISEESFYSFYLYFLSLLKTLMLHALLFGKKIASSKNQPSAEAGNFQVSKPGVLTLKGKKPTNDDTVSNFKPITLLNTKLTILVNVLSRKL